MKLKCASLFGYKTSDSLETTDSKKEEMSLSKPTKDNKKDD